MYLEDKKIIIGEASIFEIESNLGSELWPPFMRNDREVTDFWPTLFNELLKYQFAILNGDEVVGVANAMPVHWNESFSNLPDEGLDWGIEKATKDLKDNIKPNLLIGIQILIAAEYQNKGLSYTMLQTMKEVARNNGIEHIALPLRPRYKHRHPHTTMEDYITWLNQDGLAYDPWLRVHLKSGGNIIGVCNKSMLITGSISEWESWTNRTFSSSGQYEIDHALAPVTINVEENFGMYIEPNVWVVHKV